MSIESDNYNFTQLPTVLWDRKDLSVYERVILVHIIRKTIGWGKTSDGISHSQFAVDIGISKNTAIKAIKGLIAKGLIDCLKSKNNNGSCGFNIYEVSKKIVNLMNGGSAGDEQGVVQEMHGGSAGDEHTIDTITINTRTIDKELKEKVTKRNADGNKGKNVLMPDAWIPSASCFDKILKKGISREFAENLIDEFVLYWQARKVRRPGWDATFLNKVKSQFEYAQKNNKTGFSKKINILGGGYGNGDGSGKTFAEKYGHIDGINV